MVYMLKSHLLACWVQLYKYSLRCSELHVGCGQPQYIRSLHYTWISDISLVRGSVMWVLLVFAPGSGVRGERGDNHDWVVYNRQLCGREGYYSTIVLWGGVTTHLKITIKGVGQTHDKPNFLSPSMCCVLPWTSNSEENYGYYLFQYWR